MNVYKKPTLEFLINSLNNVMYASGQFSQENVVQDPFDFSNREGNV